MKYRAFPDLDRYESADDSKVRIINSAIYHFSKNGYAATKTKDIADMAEVSEALVFKHFGSKQKLLDQVSNEILETRLPAIITDRMKEQLGIESGFNQIDFLSILKDKFDYLSMNNGYFRILLQEMSHSSELTIEKFRKTVNGHFSSIESHIRHLQQEGVFRDDLPPRTIIRCLVGSLNFLLLDKSLLMNSLDTNEELEAIISIFQKGVMTHDR